jgi:hypothetical protein
VGIAGIKGRFRLLGVNGSGLSKRARRLRLYARHVFTGDEFDRH